MKRLFYIALAAILAAVLAAPLAWSQEDVYYLNSEALGQHERPLVKFNHQEHLDLLDEACITCHHDFNQNLGMSDSDGAACTDCHEAKPTADNRVDLLTAFHTRCKDCHQSLVEKGKKNAPIMCGQCHSRQNTPPEK